ncbi:MAG: OmpH family outer membrane protein [Bacteroidetes bacterium]|nr:OmpH family outer membrane protein [Bacteroidota bacterium]
MNKKIPLLINAVLIIAVGILYYLHFSNCNTSCNTTETADSTMASKPIVMSPKEIKASKIVYVNSDILNEKYDFVKDLVVEAQAKQQRLENIYQKKGQLFQQKYTEFQEKASKGLLSENQSREAQEILAKDKQELDSMEGQLQALAEEFQKSNEQVRKTVIDYVKEYNKNGQYNYILTYTEGPGGIVLYANDSLDITDEIVKGLNAQYNPKKKK